MSIYLGIVVLILSGLLFAYLYSRPNESELEKLETKLTNNKEINKYFLSLNFSKNEEMEVVSDKGYKSYPYYVLADYDNNFYVLSDKEKYNVFLKVVKSIEDEIGSISVKCGKKKYCSIVKIQVFNIDYSDNSDSFMFDTNSEEIIHFYEDNEREFQMEYLFTE